MATVTPSGADPVHYTIAASKAFVGDLRLRIGGAIPPKTVQILYPDPAPAGLVINLRKLTAPAASHSLLAPLPPGAYPDIDVGVATSPSGGTTTMTVTVVAGATWALPDTDVDWQIQVFAPATQNYELHQPNNNVSVGAVTVRRVVVDPNSAMAAPGTVLEKNNFTLGADGAVNPLTNTVHLTPGGGMADPGVTYRWTHAAAIAIGPIDNLPGMNVGPAVQAPGVYAATAVAFTQRTMFDVWDQVFRDAAPQTLTINPRTYRMVLLLDRSGSMLSNLGGGESKWAATVKAAHVWADLFVVFRGNVNAADRAAVMIFEAMPCGWAGAVAAPIEIRVPNTGLMGAIATLDATSASFSGDLQNPGACTPIGDALIAAMTNLGTGAGVDDRNVLILMTDGIENSGTIVVDNDIPLPSGALDTFDHARTVGVPGTITSALQLYTIGVGSTVQASVLDDLPNPPDIPGFPAPPAIGAYYRMANTTQELLPTFAQILGHALEAQAVAPTYDGAAHTMNFPVPADEHRIAVVLQWAAAGDDLKISYDSGGGFVQIYGPGTPAAPPAGSVTVRRRDTHGAAAIDLGLLGVAASATSWKIEYVPAMGPNDIDPAKFLAMVDLNVKAEISFDRPKYFTGEPMVVSCRIVAGGKVVPDAKVSVELARPGEGLGTFLAVNGSGYQPAPPAGADPAGGKAAMTAAILRKKEMPDLPVVTPPAIFADGSRQLFDDGAHSDGASRDGVYANVYTGADKEGTYTWRFHVEGTVPGGGKFTRLMTVSKWVGVNVDPLSSTVAVAPAAPTVKGMQAAQVTVVPVDRKGQYLGPFRQNSVKFAATSGSFTGTVVSHPDGRYSQVLHYPPGPLPIVTVTVQGKAFAPIPAAPGCLGMIINAVRALFQWLVRLGRGS
jgi:hypothetical protein